MRLRPSLTHWSQEEGPLKTSTGGYEVEGESRRRIRRSGIAIQVIIQLRENMGL